MYIHLLMPFCHCLHYTSTHFRHWSVGAMQSTHTHTRTHTYEYIYAWSHNPTQTPIAAAAFFPTDSCLSRGFYWIYLPHLPHAFLFPPLTSLSRGTTDRANWFLGRGSLHYAGTYVFKFHSCVAFFVFPFFCATLLHLPSLIYACLMCVCGGTGSWGRGLPGCHVQSDGAKLWLGICIFYALWTVDGRENRWRRRGRRKEAGTEFGVRVPLLLMLWFYLCSFFLDCWRFCYGFSCSPLS